MIDNITHRLADILNDLLGRQAGQQVDIATAYFSIRGFQQLRATLPEDAEDATPASRAIDDAAQLAHRRAALRGAPHADGDELRGVFDQQICIHSSSAAIVAHTRAIVARNGQQ
jgi:hypothetical protein